MLRFLLHEKVEFSVFVVGCGGIGGAVIDMLPQVMACLNVDLSNPGIAERVMTSEGLDQNGYDNHFQSLNLIDGDGFSGHNALRQAGVSGRKLVVQMNRLRNMDAFTVWLNSTKLTGYDTYIKPDNMSKIIMKNYGSTPIIFLCVDNHKTRYEVTRWLEANGPANFLLINGGNNKITGNVTVFERYSSRFLDPPIYKLYPEVNETTDKRPDEVSCEEVSVENDQTVLINHMIAAVMLNYFRKYIVWRVKWNYAYYWYSSATGAGAFAQKTRQKGEDGKPVELRMNEVIIDLDTNMMMSLSHKADVDNRRAPVANVENAPENIDLN